jgi:response regulator NasT
MATEQRGVVLLANERPAVAEGVAALVQRLGFEPLVADVEPAGVGRLVDSSGPVAALVAPWPTREVAAEVVGALSAVACPAVALVPTGDREFVQTVAVRGAFAVSRYDLHDLGASLEIALRRVHDRRTLLDAFERRATIEQAKGLLMARHSIDGDRAFAMLRRHSQRSNRKLVEIAQALVRSHELLQATRRAASPAEAERT